MPDAVRDDVRNPRERERQHALDHERRSARIEGRGLAPERLPDLASRPDDAAADEGRTDDVDANAACDVGKRDLRRQPREERGVGLTRDDGRHDAEGYEVWEGS